MKEQYSAALLASYATFKELYNEGRYRSPYQILAEFINYIIVSEHCYSFSLFDVKNLLNSTFGFELPTAVIKTALKGMDGVTKSQNTADYCVDRNTIQENDSFVNHRIEAKTESDELTAQLIEYARTNFPDQFFVEEELVQSFIAFLVDENTDTKYHDLISTYILKHAEDEALQERLESIRHGSVLYTGLNYNISETGSLRKNLALYLDTEILFNIAGYNGVVYQTIAEDLLTLIKNANLGTNKISLYYFADVKKEIERFFETAEDIVSGKQLSNNKPAMKAIINGCKDVADVVERMADFFQMLNNKFGIREDKNSSYYSQSSAEHNLEGIVLEGFIQDDETYDALKYISHINKLRKGQRFYEYTDAEYIFITETSRVLEASKIIASSQFGEADSENFHMCGYAINMSGITNILWYKLNKGFGRTDYPRNLDAVLKAKIVLAKHVSQKVTHAYKELKQQYETGIISKETMAARLLVLREKNEKPENITAENIEGELDFSPEYFEKYVSAIEANRTLLQEKERLLQELSDKAEFDRGQAEKKIASLENKLQTQESLQRDLKVQIANQEQEMSTQRAMIFELQQKEKHREKKKKLIINWIKLCFLSILKLGLVIAVAFLTKHVCNKMNWDYGTILSIAIGIIGIIPLIISLIKKDYAFYIKAITDDEKN